MDSQFHSNTERQGVFDWRHYSATVTCAAFTWYYWDYTGHWAYCDAGLLQKDSVIYRFYFHNSQCFPSCWSISDQLLIASILRAFSHHHLKWKVVERKREREIQPQLANTKVCGAMACCGEIEGQNKTVKRCAQSGWMWNRPKSHQKPSIYIYIYS